MLRGLAVPIGAVAAVLLVLLFNPWVEITGDIRSVVNVAFWVLFIVLLLALFEDRKAPDAEEVEIEGRGFARFLFGNSRAGLFWLPIRLFVGFAWLEAGWHKLTGPGWIDGGSALAAIWERAVAIPGRGRPPITTSGTATSSRSCSKRRTTRLVRPRSSRSARWRSGSACSSALLTGIAAFFGALMNMSFLLAGSGVDQPGPVHAGHRADPRLARRRLLRRRPLPAAEPRHAVAPGSPVPAG